MRLDQIFKIEYIKGNLTSSTKVEVLSELIDALIQGGLKIDKARALDVLMQREKLGSTGIGDGVAIPHGRVSDVDQIVVAFGRSPNGVAFDAVDGKPVNLFILLFAPEISAGQHLKALAKISKMLKAPGFRKKLIEANSNVELYETIVEKDKASS